jgi:hypothetical protein
LPHPAYSPDRVPSDLVLFGYIKGKLADYTCNTRDELKAAIAQIFGEIGQDTLRAVFVGWIKRLEWVIENGGEYYHE